jgi:Protein of unknown function (DUF2782)
MHQLFAAVLLAVIASSAMAAEPKKLKELPPPPERVKDYRPPAPAADDNLPEPEVVITTRGEDRHEEYRIGGRLYMVKVTPKVGKPYYLIDNEGRGVLQRSDLQPAISPPMWIIKEF